MLYQERAGLLCIYKQRVTSELSRTNLIVFKRTFPLQTQQPNSYTCLLTSFKFPYKNLTACITLFNKRRALK